MERDENFQFEKLSPRNQVGAIAISAASIAERAALILMGEDDRRRTFSDWESAVEHIRAKAPRSAPSDDPARWFDLRHLTQLKKGNVISHKFFAHATKTAIAEYIRERSPLTKAILGSTAGSKEEIDTLRYIHGALSKFIEPTFDLALELGPHGKSKLATSLGSNKESRIDCVVEAIFGRAITNLRHPLFRSRALFDHLLLQAEFLPVKTEDSAHHLSSNCDLYAVIREARGWSPPDAAEANLLVRDLLWIRHTREPRHNSSLSPDDEPYGIYVSAYDKRCFIVSTIDKAGPNVIVTATSDYRSSEAQRLALMFVGRESRNTLLIRDGILSGCAGENSSVAAWKCLIVKPEWPFFYHLRTLFSEELRINTADKIYNDCAELGAVGVLYSEELRNNYPEAWASREAFRQLLLAGTDYPWGRNRAVSPNIERELKELFQTIPTAAGSAIRPNLFALLAAYLQNNWHRIEPAQIVSYRRQNPDGKALSSADHNHLTLLLKLIYNNDYTQEVADPLQLIGT